MDINKLQRGAELRFDSYEEIVEKVRKVYRCRKEIAEEKVKKGCYHYQPYEENFNVPTYLMGKSITLFNILITPDYGRNVFITFGGKTITISKEVIRKAAKRYYQPELF